MVLRSINRCDVNVMYISFVSLPKIHFGSLYCFKGAMTTFWSEQVSEGFSCFLYTIKLIGQILPFVHFMVPLVV